MAKIDVLVENGRVLHIIAGSDDWCPTDEELSIIAEVFQKASSDPQGGVVVTRAGVRVEGLTSPTAGGVFHIEMKDASEAEMQRVADWVSERIAGNRILDLSKQ